MRAKTLEGIVEVVEADCTADCDGGVFCRQTETYRSCLHFPSSLHNVPAGFTQGRSIVERLQQRWVLVAGDINVKQRRQLFITCWCTLPKLKKKEAQRTVMQGSTCCPNGQPRPMSWGSMVRYYLFPTMTEHAQQFVTLCQPIFLCSRRTSSISTLLPAPRTSITTESE